MVSKESRDTLTEGSKVYVDPATIPGSPWCLIGPKIL